MILRRFKVKRSGFTKEIADTFLEPWEKRKGAGKRTNLNGHIYALGVTGFPPMAGKLATGQAQNPSSGAPWIQLQRFSPDFPNYLLFRLNKRMGVKSAVSDI